jgi:AmmeMemoRadiSam system protein A
MIAKIVKLDIEGYFQYKKRTAITMCGFVPVGVLLHLFQGPGYSARLADYSKSGDRNRDYSLSVSYASVVIHDSGGGGGRPAKKADQNFPALLTAREQQTLLALARETLVRHFRDGEKRDPDQRRYAITQALRRKAGTFVTLNINHQLRGCIGSLVSHQPIYQGVMDNVINAAIRDPRFTPVRREELDRIRIEISVMTPLKQIQDYRTIRLGKDGVVIKKGFSQAVFLPQVATETGWTLDEFLGQLCRKAGLDRTAYQSSGMDFFIFQAQVFGEEDD